MIDRTKRHQACLLVVFNRIRLLLCSVYFFFFQAEDGIRDTSVTGVQTCALPISHQTPALQKAIRYLDKATINGRAAVYAVALRACVFASLPAAVRTDRLEADKRRLVVMMIKDKRHGKGLYTYPAPHSLGTGDYSNSQYAVLGVWYAAQAGLEVETQFW